jgi:glycosyltransferase involved in cell wall biosynthesis
MPEFDTCYETLVRRHDELERVQVSNRAMEELVRSSGIAAGKVFRIPIGVDLERFRPADETARAAARAELGLPGGAFVAGSFQKDGVGWGDGLEPKLIKGPDVLVAAAARLHRQVPELVVLLTGPARGYVRAGLEHAGVPHRHVLLEDVDAVARAYRAIDVCLVTSRDEGGPKAVLEAMATGVPVVSTRVGQAADLVRDGENGWLAEVGDAEEIARLAANVAAAPGEGLRRMVTAGIETAKANSYEALAPRWAELFSGFVSMDGR